MEINGVILFDKPTKMTSRDVDNMVQKFYKTKKVGHLGTLDPFATGLLIIGINKGTKLLPFLNDDFKVYEATLKLGNKTSTGDLTGEVIESKDVQNVDLYKINEVLQGFLGKSMQKPPLYSAVKIDGKPLYKYAYNNKNVDETKIKEREIEIKEMKLISFENNEIKFICEVSKGTYVRVLAENIAEKLGTVGYLTELRRISIGKFKVYDAINELTNDENVILSPDKIDFIYPKIKISEISKERLIQGKLIKNTANLKYFIAVDQNGELISVCEKVEEGIFKSIRGLF